VILVDGPAAILVFVVVVGALAATEATEIIRVVVIRKTQWLHWFTARHDPSSRMFSNALK